MYVCVFNSVALCVCVSESVLCMVVEHACVRVWVHAWPYPRCLFHHIHLCVLVTKVTHSSTCCHLNEQNTTQHTTCWHMDSQTHTYNTHIHIAKTTESKWETETRKSAPYWIKCHCVFYDIDWKAFRHRQYIRYTCACKAIMNNRRRACFF